jgi:hypothetical protein
MRFERCLVAINLVEIIDVLVLCVLQHVEPQAARLVPFGAQGIGFDRRQKTLARLRLHPHLDPNRQHLIPLLQQLALAGGVYGEVPTASPAIGRRRR